jgi:Bardet-Biedl syndrome 2 protein
MTMFISVSRFVDIRNGAPLVLRMAVEGTSGTITVRTDNMELAGDVIQDLCSYLKLKDSEAIADFPEEMERFGAVLAQVTPFINSLSPIPFGMSVD